MHTNQRFPKSNQPTLIPCLASYYAAFSSHHHSSTCEFQHSNEPLPRNKSSFLELSRSLDVGTQHDDQSLALGQESAYIRREIEKELCVILCFSSWTIIGRRHAPPTCSVHPSLADCVTTAKSHVSRKSMRRASITGKSSRRTREDVPPCVWNRVLLASEHGIETYQFSHS